MALLVSDFKPWRPREVLKKEEYFQHMGKVYRVLESFVAESVFNPNDSRFTLTTVGQGSADDARGIADMEVNADGDLIVTYTDGQTQNAGRVRADQQEDRWTVEQLSVTSGGVISNTAEDIDNTMPTKLYVNGIVYFSVGSPTNFTISGKTITWVSAEFSLSSTDRVVAEYYKVAT